VKEDEVVVVVFDVEKLFVEPYCLVFVFEMLDD
jgi:hypothetical protein